ncbi:DNA transport machinery protein [Oceanobacillus arenosus]|uniref:DNA transport machinery protein n=1 Tax=Oceanobacillus arenosus TaxID=1229153 RepID=A0A3D8PV25_9BACI|nr:competence type IV pilus minor pilin ComGD [Oceanobacillus arenosus]RDW19191.1 DNA transport machinery protein [Oceanobacillus arenosus]
MEKLTGHKRHLDNTKGYTLLEMLMVLAIISIMLLLIVPINKSSIEKVQTTKFIELLEYDILLVQNFTTTKEELIRIRFYDERYNILQGTNSVLATRKYPPGFQIDYRGDDTIMFNNYGSMINPRTIAMRVGNKKYLLVFPLGKGRFHINEG